MSRNLLIGLGVFLAVIIAGFFLVRSPKVANAPTTSTSTPTGPVTEISISAKEFAYTPATVTVKKGEVVKINFTNDGTTAHNFTIGEFNVATKTIGPGESDSITFTPNLAGTFKYFCSVDSHRSLGLEGTLVVQ
jgi:cytochrome c oxidase subunit 2